MKVPNSEHTSRPWRIHEIVPDFRLEDVWEPLGVGGAEEFPRVVQMIAAYDPSRSSSFVVRNLFAVRWKLGELLGWDASSTGVGSRVPTLRDRLPADLRDGPSGPEFESLPFRSLYMTDNEFAAEVANQTMHGVMHIGAVPNETGDFRAQLAVYVKPNGLLGNAYMAAIRPFRYVLVYPPLLREIERIWQASGGERAPARAREAPG
jgi:hypothetical protein